MHLTLNVLRCPDAVVPGSRRSSGADIAIGRGEASDWVLGDPDRVLSKRHCVLEFRSDGWQVRDTSTNGTFLNHARAPIGRDLVAALSDGDRLRLGPYEIEVRIESLAEPWGSPATGAGTGRHLPDPVRDPLAAAPGYAVPLTPSLAGGLPEDWDPGAGNGPGIDRQPSFAESIRPPSIVPVARLPEDWDSDPGPARPVAPTPARAPAGPAVLPDDWDPLADLHGGTAAVPPPTPDPFHEPDLPERVVASLPPPAPAVDPAGMAPAAPNLPMVPPVAADAALAALLRGAGLGPAALRGADPLVALEAAGAALRAAVAGLRALLIARADVKREFRIEQTMLRSIGNNPVKFAATEEAALLDLLAKGSGPRALSETVDDLTAHQVASLAATQAAARALVERLAPDALEAADSGGGLFGAREKRLWEAYRRLHAQVAEQFDDDFDSAFGKEFARAYERAVRRETR